MNANKKPFGFGSLRDLFNANARDVTQPGATLPAARNTAADPAAATPSAATADEKEIFFRALRLNDVDAVKEILALHPAAIDWRETGKAIDQTPAHIAAHHNNSRTILLLHQHGADLDAQDKDGWTPLIFAASTGAHEAVWMLTECSAKTDIEDNSGDNALIKAVKRFRSDITPKDYSSLKTLVTAGLDPAQKTSAGDSAFGIAKTLKRDHVVLALIEANTVRIENEDIKAGKTPAIRVMKPANIKKRNRPDNNAGLPR